MALFATGERDQYWRIAIDHTRDDLAELLEESPSLRGELATVLPQVYEQACDSAGFQLGLDKEARLKRFPAQCPWEVEAILDYDFPHQGMKLFYWRIAGRTTSPGRRQSLESLVGRVVAAMRVHCRSQRGLAPGEARDGQRRVYSKAAEFLAVSERWTEDASGGAAEAGRS